tara:strand:+ start:211 stop:1104 length:894 start_codon:yes stop_codon:yes gene_type:complete
MSRPLRFDGTAGLIEMTDADLDRICYYLRVAFANVLQSGGHGSVNVGGSGTTFGSMSDTSRTQRVNTGSNTQPAPGTGTETDASFTYKQIITGPSSPSDNTLNTEGFQIIDGTSGTIAATEAQIAATVISQTIQDMRVGDEVGTYRVSTSNPGGGTWVDMGTWFIDTTYTSTTTYKLWLKTAHTSIPGSNIYPLVIDGVAGLKEVDIITSSDLVQNVLLPILQRDLLSNNSLRYNQQVTQVSGVARGTISDTRLSGTSETQNNPPAGTDPGGADVYRTFSTPSGSAANHNVQIFYMI